MIRPILLTATVLAIAAPLAAAPTTMGPDFVKQAGAGDLFEKTSSQLVLKSAKNPKVRDFANMMIKDHTRSTADIKVAATADGLKPMPPKLSPAQAKMIADLKAAKPGDREKVYVSQQVMAHQQALDLMQTYAKGGDKPTLKGAAAKIVPIVETHLTEVKSMASM